MITVDSKKVTKMMRDYFSGALSASEVASTYGVGVNTVYVYAKKLEKLGVSRKLVKKSPTRQRTSEWNVIADKVSKYVYQQERGQAVD